MKALALFQTETIKLNHALWEQELKQKPALLHANGQALGIHLDALLRLIAAIMS